VQPGVTKIGGIAALRKIAALSGAYAIKPVPHCAYCGPGNPASIDIVEADGLDTLLAG